MGGVAYTVGDQPVLVGFSVVTGPSFNDLDFDDDFVRTLPAELTPELDIDNSFAVRLVSTSRSRLRRASRSLASEDTCSTGPA